jgi:hypothetical protein
MKSSNETRRSRHSLVTAYDDTTRQTEKKKNLMELEITETSPIRSETPYAISVQDKTSRRARMTVKQKKGDGPPIATKMAR